MGNHRSIAGRVLGLAVLFGLFGSQASRAQTPPPLGYSIQEIGLGGAGDIKGINSSGQATGTSGRRASNGTSLGADAFQFDGAVSHNISLGGAGYEYATPDGNFRIGDLIGIDNSGNVVGYAVRFGSSGGDLGSDAWRYNGNSTQVVGFTGPGYEYTIAAGTYRGGTPTAINRNGQIIGHNARYASDGSDLGWDGWLWNAGILHPLGLTGSDYQFPTPNGLKRIHTEESLNASGMVIGWSGRWIALDLPPEWTPGDSMEPSPNGLD